MGNPSVRPGHAKRGGGRPPGGRHPTPGQRMQASGWRGHGEGRPGKVEPEGRRRRRGRLPMDGVHHAGGRRMAGWHPGLPTSHRSDPRGIRHAQDIQQPGVRPPDDQAANRPGRLTAVAVVRHHSGMAKPRHAACDDPVNLTPVCGANPAPCRPQDTMEIDAGMADRHSAGCVHFFNPSVFDAMPGNGAPAACVSSMTTKGAPQAKTLVVLKVRGAASGKPVRASKGGQAPIRGPSIRRRPILVPPKPAAAFNGLPVSGNPQEPV